MQPKDFIVLAEQILHQGGQNPSKVALRRSLSTIYYALFHTLAKTGADLLVGQKKSFRSEHAWRQVYRGLEHGSARKACEREGIMKDFPLQIQNFGVIFVEMQRIRHRADYDPHVDFEEALAKHFVDGIIERVRQTIQDFNATSEKDRRAFCVYILFKTRP